MSDKLPTGFPLLNDKLIAVQEMKERTVAPEDEAVQKVVGGDSSRAIPMQVWKEGNLEQMTARADRKPHEFRTLEEQLKRNGSLIIERAKSKQFCEIYEGVRKAVDDLYMFFQLTENNSPVATDQAGCVLASRFLLRMLALEQDSHDDGYTEKMVAPILAWDEGIPSLIWTENLRDLQVGKRSAMWFAFYGDGDIVMHKQLANGEGSTTYAFKYDQHDLRTFYEMILEYGGKPDA